MSVNRAPRGFTYEPCHACGQVGLHPRPKEGVCNTCRDIFKRAKQRAEELEAAGDQGAIPVYMNERPYALPYLGNCKRDDVQRAFFDLGQTLSEPTTERPPYSPADPPIHRDPWPDYEKWSVWPHAPHGTDRSGHEWRCVRAMRPDIKAQLGSAYAAVRTAVEEAYKNGHQSGRNLLMQLASGTITSDKFNEASARIDSEGRQ